MQRLARRALTVAAFSTLASAVSVAGPGALLPQANAAAVCSEAPGGTKFYPGDDSSAVYNNTFRNSVGIDHFLQDYVPQGLGVWRNWNGAGEDVFLIGMHHRDEENNRSLIYAITTTGAFRGAVHFPEGGHAGGLKVYKNWLYVQHSTSLVRRYKLGWVKTQLQEYAPGDIKGLGKGNEDAVSGVSFFDIRGGHLYGGRFNDENRDWMYRYTIDEANDGKLVRDTGWARVQVPKKAQGIAVLKDAYVFSTSAGRNNHSNVYVTRRDYTTNFEDTDYTCFEAPVLSQELVRYGGNTYLSFEGGADAFDGNFPWTTADNKIKNLHVASNTTLRGMIP